MPEDLNRANLIGVARVAAPEDGAREALQKVHPVILSRRQRIAEFPARDSGQAFASQAPSERKKTPGAGFESASGGVEAES